MGEKIPMIGNRYGRLVVIEEAPSQNQRSMVICKCDCGNITKAITASDLRRGKTNSCGCLRLERIKEANKKHGDGHSRLNVVWTNMKQRCYNPNSTSFKDYGARGIRVCDEWKDDFGAFRDWAINSGYEEHANRGRCTLERIDVNGNYEPSNCRWATQKEQCNNLRKNLLIEIDGRTQTLKQWANESGLDEAKIRYRYKHGYTGLDLIKKERCTRKR